MGRPGPGAGEGHGPSSRGPLGSPAHGGVPGFSAQASLTRPPPPPGSPGVIETCPADPAEGPSAHRPCGRIRWCLSSPGGRLGEEPTRTWWVRAEPASSSNTATRPVSSRSLGAEGRVRGRPLLPLHLQAGRLAWPAVVQLGEPGAGPAQVHSLFTVPRVADQDTQARPMPDPHPAGPGFPRPCLRLRNLCRLCARGLGLRWG